MHTILKIASVSALAAASAQASVTIAFNADSLRTSDGTPAPTDTLAMLVADADGLGFGALSAGSINQFDTIGSGDVVVARFDFSTFATPGVIFEAPSGINLTGFDTGDELAIVWFPGLTTADTAIAQGQSYGLLSSSAWTVPSDGGTATGYQVISTSNNGFFGPTPETLNVTDVQSQAAFTAVPEPRAYAAIAGALALGALTLRRRRS